MKIVEIKTNGLESRKSTFTSEGAPIHGVRSADIRMRIGEPVTARLEILSTFEGKAKTKFMVTDPTSGALKEVRRVEFFDDSVFEG